MRGRLEKGSKVTVVTEDSVMSCSKIIVLVEQETSFELAGEFKIAPTGRGFLFAVLAV